MKAKALHILNEYAPASATESRWTPKLVKAALVDAFRIAERYGGSVGPSQPRAAWPEYNAEREMSHHDFVVQSLAGTLEKRAARIGLSSLQISRTEMILYGWTDENGENRAAWLRGPLLGYPDYREKLLAWIKSEVRRVPATEMCRRKGWPYATFKRHRDSGAEIIAQRLNKAGLAVW